MKKVRTISLLVLLFCSFCFNKTCVVAQKNEYVVTNYKSFNDVKKDYLKKKNYRDFGLRYAYITLKTIWSSKKAIIICNAGLTADITKTHIFIKYKGKIYQINNFFGFANSISKDRKYMFVNGGGTFFKIYKYSNGRYKKYKYIFNNGQKKYDSQKKKLSEKYGISKQNIKYIYQKN